MPKRERTQKRPATLVPPCDSGSPGRAVPDPCVASSVFAAGNTYIEVTVLSSTASRWNEATPKLGAVTVSDKGFSPATVSLPLGASVAWSFTGKKSHSATDAVGLGPSRAPLFDSGPRKTGTYTAAPLVAAGSYPYLSTVKGDCMTGTVALPIETVPSTGSQATAFTVVWAATTLSGYVFDVQVRFRPASSNKWKAWTTFAGGTTRPNGRFTPDQGTGTYAFQARLRNSATGRASGWSPETTISVS